MQCGNQLYKALFIKDETPVISHDMREQLLTSLCAHYDVEALRPKRKARELYAAWKWALEAKKNKGAVPKSSKDD